jgi:hypothetical protein
MDEYITNIIIAMLNNGYFNKNNSPKQTAEEIKEACSILGNEESDNVGKTPEERKARLIEILSKPQVTEALPTLTEVNPLCGINDENK